MTWSQGHALVQQRLGGPLHWGPSYHVTTFLKSYGQPNVSLARLNRSGRWCLRRLRHDLTVDQLSACWLVAQDAGALWDGVVVMASVFVLDEELRACAALLMAQGRVELDPLYRESSP